MAHLDEAVWAAIAAHEDTKLDKGTSREEIAMFETQHGVQLPPSHKEFLLRANGGMVGCARLFGVNRNDALDLSFQIAQIRPYLEPPPDGPVLPFANDWGGSYFCYDMHKAGTSVDYPVLFWDHELSEEPELWPNVWSLFADNFVAFVMKVVSE